MKNFFSQEINKALFPEETLLKNFVENTKIHKLNLSRVTEQALYSILDFMQVQNIESV